MNDVRANMKEECWKFFKPGSDFLGADTFPISSASVCCFFVCTQEADRLARLSG